MPKNLYDDSTLLRDQHRHVAVMHPLRKAHVPLIALDLQHNRRQLVEQTEVYFGDAAKGFELGLEDIADLMAFEPDGDLVLFPRSNRAGSKP